MKVSRERLMNESQATGWQLTNSTSWTSSLTMAGSDQNC